MRRAGKLGPWCGRALVAVACVVAMIVAVTPDADAGAGIGEGEGAETGAILHVGPGFTYANCGEAVRALPPEGGTILLEPVEYDRGCSLSLRDRVHVKGIIGPDGALPVIRPRRWAKNGEPVLDSKGRQKWGVAFSVAYKSRNTKPDSFHVIENVSVKESIHAFYGQQFGHVVLRNFHVDTCKHNGIWVSKPSSAVKHEMVFEMYGGSVAHCGRGNMRHNLYVNAHRIVIDGLVSHAANNSEAFKSGTGRDITIRNSTFATTLVPEGKLTPDEASLSTTLIVIPSCSRSRIHNNRLVSVPVSRKERTRGMRAVGRYMLSYRARRSIKGCDQPPYDPTPATVKVGETPSLFWSDDFWAGVRAGGLDAERATGNPALFRHYLWNNTFVVLSRGTKNASVALQLIGTVPQWTVREGGRRRELLPRPRGWVERFRLFAFGNKFIGRFDPLIEHRYRDYIETGERLGLGGKGMGGAESAYIEFDRKPSWWPGD